MMEFFIGLVVFLVLYNIEDFFSLIVSIFSLLCIGLVFWSGCYLVGDIVLHLLGKK